MEKVLKTEAGESEVEALARMMANGFIRIDEQFTKVDKRFDTLDGRLDEVDTRFDRIEEVVLHTSQRVDVLEQKVDETNELIRDIITPTLKAHEGRIARIEKTVFA
jgi:vacuolar-type H+-ATPase subunit D/Vma8